MPDSRQLNRGLRDFPLSTATFPGIRGRGYLSQPCPEAGAARRQHQVFIAVAAIRVGESAAGYKNRAMHVQQEGEDMDSLEQTLATVHDLLRAERLDEAAALLRRCPASAEQVGYDNWNGGTDIYEVRLELPPSEFARLGTRCSQLEEQIAARLKTVLEPETQDWYSVRFVPAKATRPDWRSDGQADAPQREIALPRQVRQNIVDGLKLEKVAWFGTLDDVEFLSRLYDLNGMPSNDSRYKDAAGDIWQHRFNNDDWENDWVYSDDRFKLLDGSAEAFLRFLCEVVHPVVRPSRDEAIKLVSHFNDQLRQAGWEIFEEEFIAGRPRFSYRPLRNQTARAVMRARTVADALDAGWMAKEIERLEQAVDRDPALAIGMRPANSP